MWTQYLTAEFASRRSRSANLCPKKDSSMISIRHLGPIILSELDSTATPTIWDDLNAEA